MLRGLWSGATGMQAQELKINVVANNLANVSTTGFKKSRSNFQDLIYQTMKVAGAETPDGGQVPTGIQVGLGVKAGSVQKLFTQGDYVQTDNQLDMAIEGDGMFQVIHNGNEFYTRAGNFTLDSEGFITTPIGDRLQPEISIPEETAVIDMDSYGQITGYDRAGAITIQETVTIHTFINPSGLYAAGDNLFQETEGSGTATEGTPGDLGYGTTVNGFLEMSNVSVVEEMVEMIVGQRAYEANSKTIQTADSMLQMANNLKR
ncbi:MAG: flagellar basal-body rod protein FlgG [Desulfobacterales bacterium]|nr:flagellar basal-body rod protein FlgG [Desulfobacterales bacterium]